MHCTHAGPVGGLRSAVSRNRRIGAWGEDTAADYLAGLGYTIVSRNVRTPYGEIDLLAARDGLTVFVEVKTRTTETLGPPEVAVSARKQSHMIACAQYFAQQHAIDHWRIDVIAVKRLDNKVSIKHFGNAVT